MKNEKITSLDDLTKCRINSIIHSFGENERIFQSEAQFQFELAWAIQQQIANAGNTKKVKVLLEVLYAVNGDDKGEVNQRIKRSYADIVVKDNEGKYIVIELKYKVKESEYGKIKLPNQGASNLGRYDYLWDLHRIEVLRDRDSKEEIHTSDGPLTEFDRGFAIILTNEKRYWDITSNKAQTKDGRKYRYAPYCIGGDEDGNGVLSSGERGQLSDSRSGFTIESDYDFKWEGYPYANTDEQKSYEFKFLTLEVKP